MKGLYLDVELAAAMGSLDKAVMLTNLAYWIEKNQANGKHFYDGRYWTYNSQKAFSELFPFWTVKQVRRILDSLKAEGFIDTGNFNQNRYDRTMWYSLTEKACAHLGESTRPFGRVNETVWENDSDHLGSPIPKIYTNIKQSVYTDRPLKPVDNLQEFSVPTLEDCREYASVMKMVIDADFFFQYHEAGNWHDKKGRHIRNWKQEMLSWNKQELKNPNVLPARKIDYAN